jgi:phosphate transport system protein
MTRILQREIEKLKKMILAESAVVEESVSKSVRAVKTRDAALAIGVVDSDEDIDQTEVGVEEECLKVLALHQPVASDLRFIIAVLKINNDLERIGDLAVNIAQRAEFLAAREPVEQPYDLTQMSNTVCEMLHKSLDALVNTDAPLAGQVCAMDSVVDAMNRSAFAHVQDAMRRSPDRLEGLVSVLSVSRYLERIADHATNIAEDVIYMLQGEIIRHKMKKAQGGSEGLAPTS